MKSLNIMLAISLLAFSIDSYGQTEVSGNITVNTEWTAGNYVLTGNVIVKGGAVLTIAAGAQVDLGNYTLQVGSSTAGMLNASNAGFHSANSSDRKLFFLDGGGGTLSGCTFSNVFIDIEADASESITLTNNSFTNVDYPVTSDINRIPVLTGNQSDTEIIGISGNLAASKTLPEMNWYYQVTSGITVRNGAVLTILEGATIDLAANTMVIGSTTPGELYADGVLFKGSGTTDRKISFRDGGTGTIKNCVLDNVTVQTDADAGLAVLLTNNRFTNITYPVLAHPGRIPSCYGNTSPVERMGLGGTVAESCTIIQTQWSIDLTASILVRGGAVLTIPNGVMVDLRTYTIFAGNSTAGEISADGAIFMGSGSGDRPITFIDGGKGEIRDCILINVYVNIEADAGKPVTISGNSFEDILYPIRMAVTEGVVIEDNTSTAEWIGLRGSVSSGRTLSPSQWNYVLTDHLTINNDATLAIEEGVDILMNGKYLYIGSGSTSPGDLQAEGVRFHELPGKSGWIHFSTGSTGTLSGCDIESVRMQIQSSSPTISGSKLYHANIAVYLTGAANPVFENNDFYNNVTAIDNRGTGIANAQNNFWAHPSGPQHAENPEGLGETVSGWINYDNFLAAPVQGSVIGEIVPEKIVFTAMATGTRMDSSFVLVNRGDEDMLVAGITNTTSSVSVKESDRFWIPPDSSRIIRFSFSLYQQGVTRDTIVLNSSNMEQPLMKIPVEGRGEVEGLVVNFFHIDVDSFPVVRCHFTVTDQAGLPVRTLTKQDLELTEQALPVTDYELILRSEDNPVRVALVMDRSGSMSGQRLRDAKTAASDFVNHLRDEDMGALISFSDEIRLNQAFTSDKTLLVNKIKALSATGGTAIFDAISMALDQVTGQTGIRAILALTDGEDNASHVIPDEIIARANENRINIYCIGLGVESEPLMSRIASETGGQYFFAPTSEELGFIYRAISGQIQNLYIARYLASETLPYPRKVEITAAVYDKGGSDYRYYSMEDFSVDFLSWDDQPLRNATFSRNAVNYFYYLIDQATNQLPVGYEFNYLMDARYKTFPCGGKYMGDGIMQFWIDLTRATSTGDYTIYLPDTIGQTGGHIFLNSKPDPFVANVTRRVITQGIDIFAGGSLGAKAMAGALGAGVSVAAASVSASGSAGMGINFERDQAGNQFVTRRLEVGVSTKVEAPSINTGIDLIDMGLSAEITTKGTVGQTMAFPFSFPDKNTLVKAKSAYLLETMAIGGLAISPFVGIVLKAVQSALVTINPDVDEVYDDFFQSWNVGASTEGRIGVGFKLSPGKGSGLPALTFAEAGASIGLGATFEHQVQDGGLNFGLELATGFDFSLLNLEFAGYDLGKLFQAEVGSAVTLDAGFTTSDGFEAFNLGFLVYGVGDVLYYEEFDGELYEIRVPRAVIEKALNTAGNLVYSVNQLFTGGGLQPDLMIGPSALTSGVGDIFAFNEEEFSVIDEHITFSKTDQSGKGVSAEVKVGLDLALGVGAGLEFGVNFAYMDLIAGPVEQYAFARGNILPLATYPDVTRQDKLFSITDEMYSLFDGVIRLVKDGIANLVAVGEWLYDAGTNLIIGAFDQTIGLAGEMEQGGKAVIRKFDPRNWGVIDRPFLDPAVIRVYGSDRIMHQASAGGLKSGNSGESHMYVISDSYNVSLFNGSGDLLDEFAPLQLTLAIAGERLTDLGFGANEKPLARIYRYVPEIIGWELVGVDSHAHPDSVSCDIYLSGTYAVGIEIFPSHDQTAPAILDHYPGSGGTIAPTEKLWARLFEEPVGVGIDFSRTGISIDGIEVEAMWDPVNSVVSWRPDIPLAEGLHLFSVVVTDFNGNVSNLDVSFNVAGTGVETIPAGAERTVRCYPNPFAEWLTIEVGPGGGDEDLEVAVYDLSGSRVAVLYIGTPPAGTCTVTWNRLTGKGMNAPAGTYFIRVKEENRIRVIKVIAN